MFDACGCLGAFVFATAVAVDDVGATTAAVDDLLDELLGCKGADDCFELVGASIFLISLGKTDVDAAVVVTADADAGFVATVDACALFKAIL